VSGKNSGKFLSRKEKPFKMQENPLRAKEIRFSGKENSLLMQENPFGETSRLLDPIARPWGFPTLQTASQTLIGWRAMAVQRGCRAAASVGPIL
jgi:hypothetical protein